MPWAAKIVNFGWCRMKIIEKISKKIGLVSEWTGKTAMWLLVVLITVIAVDVFMRYVLNKPTTWSFPIAYMTGAVLITSGLCYVHYHQVMVRVDVIYVRFSPKTKLLVDIVLGIICLLPFAAILAISFGVDAFNAYLTQEVATETTWYPLIWPYRAAAAIGFGLLFVQGIGTLLHEIAALTKGKEESW